MSMDEIAGEQLKVSDYDGIVKEYSEKKIPKIIHYAWLGEKNQIRLKEILIIGIRFVLIMNLKNGMSITMIFLKTYI